MKHKGKAVSESRYHVLPSQSKNSSVGACLKPALGVVGWGLLSGAFARFYVKQ